MSKITNPVTEQSVSCGFYNSIGDRKYDAAQMSKIFDGIIKDGVFASIGSGFAVTVPDDSSEAIVNVGTGKCWFNHTWTENDAVLPIECPISEVALNRIDAIIIKIDSNDTVRDNFITVKKGTPASYPSRPAMEHSEYVNEYAICYINRTADSKVITPSDITYVVGEEETPFITGILETFSSDEFMQKWKYELDQFVKNKDAELTEFVNIEKSDVDAFMTARENDFNEWYSQMQALMKNVIDETDNWTNVQKNTILAWFENMKGQLSADSAANLQIQFDKSEVERILMLGLSDGSKTTSEDGSLITTIDSIGRKLVKTFTNNFLTSTSVLYSPQGGELGKLTKNFSEDGRTVNSELSVYCPPGDVEPIIDTIISEQNRYINGGDDL